MARRRASLLPAIQGSKSTGRIKRGIVAAVLGFTVAACVLSPWARADGDPASDYLLVNRVFLSYGSAAVSTSQRQLLHVVQAANRAGFAIRVAIISSNYDLGSITALWRRPRLYVRFLGLELSSVYKQRLLVVMPNGFGFNWPGHASGSAYRVLEKIPIGANDVGLTGATQTAVRQLAGAAGITLTPLTTARATGMGAHAYGPALIIGGAVVALTIGLALLPAVRRRRRARPVVSTEPSAATRVGSRISLRWAVPGLAALCGVAVAAPIVVVSTLRHGGQTSGVATGSVVTPPPFTWPAGRRPAPEFVLQDQHGRRVSLAAYRGRPVILTFVDPLCRNLCPLEAKVLNDVVDRMHGSKRPEILAVSVDVYADVRANLLQDVRKWELVPQWHWAVGRAAQLAAVWKSYEIGVRVTTKKISGTTINYITHTEAAYVIDASGHERALFLWPFYPQDVQRTLRQLP